MEYTTIIKDEIKFITFDKLSNIPFIKHGFSTRIGGVSEDNYKYLNLGLNTGDDTGNVKENIKKFSLAVGINYQNLVVSDQVHKDLIKVATYEDRGKGYIKERDYSEIDGLVTNALDIPLMTIFADCVPIFFVDTIKKAIGVSHAGWKGTKLKIGQKTVGTMINEYGSKPENIIALIGPSIGRCCYEVDDFVVDKFNKSFTDTSSFIFPYKGGRYKLDLWEANKLALEEVGVKDIIVSKLCTSCNLDLFYSYRREDGITGRMGAIIQLI